MTLIEDLTVETVIPFKQLTNFSFLWQLDKHVVLNMEGILDRNTESSIYKDYKTTKIKVEYSNEILFYGAIKETAISVLGGVYQIKVIAVSASLKLDTDVNNEMFQNVSITYKQMMQEMLSKMSGQIICTIGNEFIEKPLLCYEETVWQFARRMASHFNSHIIADIRTGKPALWFGMRQGIRVKKHDLVCNQVQVRKSVSTKHKDKVSCFLKGKNNYQLGDLLFIDNDWQIIYEKEVCLERGEIMFSYLAAREDTLGIKTYFQENITGLSLKGTVERTEKEQIFIKLDIDGKAGVYPFSWYPETGNVLYAMPEEDAKVEVYFMGPDEREAIAIRCRDTKETEGENKKIELMDSSEISLDQYKIRMEKADQVTLLEREINLKTDKNLKISAVGKVKISARTIEIISTGEIKWVTSI